MDRAPKSHRNSLTAHVQMNAIGNFFGGNVGLDYERFLDKQGYISAAVSLNYGVINDHFLDGQINEYTDANPFYATPGIRVHPFGNARRVDLSIGSQLAIGDVYTRHITKDNQGGKLTIKSDLFMMAYVAEINANFHPEGRTVFGLHFGIGQHTAASEIDRTFFEFGLRVGSGF